MPSAAQSDFLQPVVAFQSHTELVPESPHVDPGQRDGILGSGLTDFDVVFANELGDDSAVQDHDHSVVAATEECGDADNDPNLSNGSLELKFQSDSPVFCRQLSEEHLLQQQREEDALDAPQQVQEDSLPKTMGQASSKPPSTSSVDSSNLNLSDLNREVSAIPIVKSSILVGSSKADTSEAGTMVMETSFSPGAKPSSAKLKSHKTTLTRQLDILLEHKHRTLFERAVTDKQAANYSRFLCC